MLAGPLDFHQGSFRGVSVEQFRPRNEAPLVMGTPARMLASYVVFQNHLPMVADYPSAYRGHPAMAMLAAIPTTWDDTRCLAGKVGELIIVARRSGSEWWVGAMGGREPREVKVTLDFIGPGRYGAEIVRDQLEAPGRVDQSIENVRRGETIRASLAPTGGLLIRLSQIPTDKPPRPRP
jgi:alpha-glucosidase